MHNEKNIRLVYYAKILIFVSITLLVYGLILDINNEKRLFDPVEDVVNVTEEENTISITTVDGSEVVSGNTITNTTNGTKEDNKNGKNNSNVPSPTGANKNNNNSDIVSGGYNNNNSSSNNNGSSTGTVSIPTLDDVNNNLRNSIQNTYGITVKYGNDTVGYKVGGFSTTPIDNSTAINAALNRLKNALNLYPNGFFSEIRNGGIPLTVLLINNYSDNSITGVTDSSYSYANISIALVHPFEESFYHESYHYIERYILKSGGSYNTWNSINPSNFQYGTIINNYSYANTFAEGAPFVNNYAQSSATEDRASTFEYMMANSKASCLNRGQIVWQKANLMKNTIEAVFNTVSPTTTEYWERYI